MIPMRYTHDFPSVQIPAGVIATAFFLILAL